MNLETIRGWLFPAPEENPKARIITKGREAEGLRDSPVLNEAFKDLQVEAFMDFLSATPGELLGIHQRMLACIALKRKLDGYVESKTVQEHNNKLDEEDGK